DAAGSQEYQVRFAGGERGGEDHVCKNASFRRRAEFRIGKAVRARRTGCGGTPPRRLPPGKSPLSNILQWQWHVGFLWSTVRGGFPSTEAAHSRAFGLGWTRGMGRRSNQEILQRHASAPWFGTGIDAQAGPAGARRADGWRGSHRTP